MEDVDNYCEKSLPYDQTRYPVIRGLSQDDVIHLMRDNSLSRKLFPHNSIMVGLERLIPSVENCNKHVLFQENHLYAAPKEGDTTALASCVFIPQAPPNLALMYIGLHGAITSELAAAFYLWFLPQSRMYQSHESELCIRMHNLSKFDSDLIIKQLQIIPMRKEIMPMYKERAIGLDTIILVTQI